MHRLQDRFTPTAKWRWALFLLCCILTGMGLSVAIWLIETQNPLMTLLALKSASYWYTSLLLFCVAAVLGFLTHSLFAGALLTALPALVLTLINFYKLSITATPFQLGDFQLADRLGDIVSLNAQSIQFSLWSCTALIAVVLWLAVLWLFSRPLRPKWRWSLLAASASVVVFFLLFFVGANKLVYTPLKAPLNINLTQSIANERCGTLLGLWRSNLCAIQVRVKLREYSQDTMEEILTQALKDVPPSSSPDREQPNIILILSESFFDVTTLPGVTYDSDPLAEFHALQEEGVSGTFYTRTLGYGTCNIELEILTGINTALLSREDLYNLDPSLLTRLPAVPTLLQNSGYETILFHLFNDSIYERTPLFQAIGFNQLYFSGDFASVDPEAAAAADYWAFMNERISGGYYSDEYMIDLFIDLYEQQGAADPLFLYGISMENHTPHNGTKYTGEERTVSFTSPLTGEAAAVLADVSQGVANASRALGRLADYFREQDEPTVIIFYGDHRPGLGLSDNISSAYSALGMTPGIKQSQWTENQLMELYSTSYLIWSNDPDYLPVQAGSTSDSSSNYLGLSVLDAAGVELPLYWRILKDASSVRIIDSPEFYLGRDGAPSRAAPTDEKSSALLERLTFCFYDALYGKQYITGQLWE